MKPEAVLFSPAEIGWLQEAAKRAKPFSARAEAAAEAAAAVVNAALAGVLAGHRDALPKDGRFQVLRDQEGLPIAWRAMDELPEPPQKTPHAEPTRRQVAAATASALRSVAEKAGAPETKKALLQAAEDEMKAAHEAEEAAHARA